MDIYVNGLESVIFSMQMCILQTIALCKGGGPMELKLEFVMRCAIWYHLNNLKNVKNTYGGLLPLVKLHALTCNFTKSSTSPWVFFTFLKLFKWYQIAQRIY